MAEVCIHERSPVNAEPGPAAARGRAPVADERPFAADWEHREQQVVVCAEGVWLCGVVAVRSSGAPLLDVRARVGERIFWATFDATVTAPGALRYRVLLPGATALPATVVEGCAPDGHWRALMRSGADAGAFAGGASARLAGDRYLRALAMQQQFPGWSLAHASHALRDAERACPLEIAPRPPWWGSFDSLQHAEVVWDHGQLSIWGWLAHERQRVVRMQAGVHPWMMVDLTIGRLRPDVPRVFPHLIEAETAGFEGQVPVPASCAQPWGVAIVATLADGSRELVFATRVWAAPFAAEMHDSLPVFSWSRALSHWLRWRRLHPWPEWRAELRAIAIWRANAAVDERRCEAELATATTFAGERRATRVIVVNDNLRLGGAALFAFELATFLQSRCGWCVRFVAPESGPLAAAIKEQGMDLDVIDVGPVSAAGGEADFTAGVRELAARLDWAEADLVIINTLAAFWAVPVAKVAGKPTLLYVHEGARAGRLFGRGSPAAWIDASGRAIKQATRVVFVTRWTWEHHRAARGDANFRLARSWVNLARIDELQRRRTRAEWRRRHGVPLNAVVFVCLGSICDRKGQRTLVRAMQWWRDSQAAADREPLPQLYLVGATDTPDVRRLREEIAAAELGCVHLVGETHVALEWLSLADAYVCPSVEEGFPRALMEAAAFRKWIVATRIPGVREMLGDGEAWLVRAGDPPSLARAMRAVVRCIRRGDDTRPAAARRLVERWWDAEVSLPVHAGIAAEAAAAVSERRQR